MIWSKLQNTIMQKELCSLPSNYQFFEYGTQFSIGIVSWQPWQANGVVVWSWKALQSWFQFLSFLEKFPTWLWLLGAASRVLALGLACLYMNEWFRLRIWSKESRNWWNNIWFSMPLFSNLFHAILVQIMFNHQDTFQTWFARNIE